MNLIYDLKWKIHLFKLALTIPFNSFIVTLFVYAIFLIILFDISDMVFVEQYFCTSQKAFYLEQLAILSFLSNTLPYSRG